MDYKLDTPFYPTNANIITFCSEHMGVIKDLKDPERRGRVRIEVPGLLSTGKDNWTGWAEGSFLPWGSSNSGDGDEGIFWSPPVGQICQIGFTSGEPTALFWRPGPPVQDGDGENKQLTPKEQQIAGKENPRDATRVRGFKSEAGHTLFFDDRGGKEMFFLVDCWGAGGFSVGPGKIKDEEEKEREESKPRKGERRGTKTVAAQTSGTVKDLIEGAKHILAWLDLNGQGIISVASDGNGVCAVHAAAKNGEVGPSALFDTEKNRIYLTAGEVQIVARGDKGDVQFTRSLIQELDEKYPVEDWIKAMKNGLKERFKEFDE